MPPPTDNHNRTLDCLRWKRNQLLDEAKLTVRDSHEFVVGLNRAINKTGGGRPLVTAACADWYKTWSDGEV